MLVTMSLYRKLDFSCSIPIIFVFLVSLSISLSAQDKSRRVRIRELGYEIGIYSPGPYNAITDVEGVRVGHVTLNRGSDVRTGVTAVIPNSDMDTYSVVGAAFTIHGNGEMTGMSWTNDSGYIESPIMLTNTLSVGAVHEGVARHLKYISLPIVGECYDGYLNNIRGLHVRPEHAIEAIETATAGPVDEGCVGAGTGMRCYQFKSGIGTASRRISKEQGGYVVGVLVNANGGRRHQLRIDGVPVGQEIPDLLPFQGKDGSFIIVIATDAPLTHRQLRQLCLRATHGLARTGTPSTMSSGEFVIAFSTANKIPRQTNNKVLSLRMLQNQNLDALYQAVIESTEEAIYNSMTMATTSVGKKERIVHAIPIDRLQKTMKKYGY